jgi:hypothetical protein
MRVAFVLASVALLSARPARADQCQWLDDASIARRAIRELRSHPELVQFCEPCGDTAPGEPRRANQVAMRTLDGHREVSIDGETVDLAYVYVKMSGHLYRNLAMLAGCAATGVSPRLRVDPATPTSVMIRAELAPARPAPAPPSPAPPAMTAPEVEPAAATRIIYVELPPDSTRRWLAGVALLASLGALGAWRMARRRPSHVPRATSLRPRD